MGLMYGVAFGLEWMLPLSLERYSQICFQVTVVIGAGEIDRDIEASSSKSCVSIGVKGLGVGGLGGRFSGSISSSSGRTIAGRIGESGSMRGCLKSTDSESLSLEDTLSGVLGH